MAKGNLFLGQARGSVGDVVFYRAGGQQVSRSRNRHPSNPNSTKQSIQRAVSASIQRLYSIGQVLFNHSFQGKRPGMENQMEFAKRNSDILRSLVLSELNAGTADAQCQGRVGAPGLSVAVPFPGALVSNGTYQNNTFEFDSAVKGFKLVGYVGTLTVAQLAQAANLIAGDIYTFGAIGVDVDGKLPLYSVDSSDPYASVYKPVFNYVQLRVKDGLSGDTRVVSDLKIEDLFDQVGGTAEFGYLNLSADISIDDINVEGSDHGCIFCIRSRWDEDLRSTSYLMPGTTEMSYGLTANHLLAAWRDKLGLDEIELVLEGRDFSAPGAASYVSKVLLSGVQGLTEWPTVMDIQKLSSQAPDGFTVNVLGEGIESGILNNGDIDINMTVAADGKSAYYIYTPPVAAGECTIKINGAQYGKILEFTE